MNNFQVPIQLMSMLKGGNPQQILSGMLQKNDNPMFQNIVSLMNSGDSKGIEQITRNLCKSKGIDPDEMMKQIQEQFR